MELDDILNGQTPEDTSVAEIPADLPPEIEASDPSQPRDEHGRFAPKGEDNPAEPVAAPPAAQEHVIPPGALAEERRKRQELEQQVQRLQSSIQQSQNPPPQAPSIFDDEQGWEQHFGQTVVQQAVEAASQNARLDMSEMMTRQANPDFEEKKAAFLALMQNTPGLQERALQDPHPWSFAYQYVANQQRMQELSAVNVADLEAKLRAQIQAEYEAKGHAVLGSNLPAGVPPSLSSQRNVGSRTGPAWAGPSPLSDILNRN
jgi:hypothetical protein